MRRCQAFKFELLPRGRQRRDMHRFVGACRYVFNQALALQKTNYAAGGKFIGYVAMAKRLTEWRNDTETPWCRASCQVGQNA
jgi:putative transposase